MITLILALILAAPPADGKEVFLKHKCNNCHAVSAAGIEAGGKVKTKAPDLTDVTLRHQKAWMRKFIRQNEIHTPCKAVDSSMNGKKHPAKFNGTNEEEDILINWLDKQRSKK